MNYISIRLAIVLLSLAVAFRVAMPAYVEYTCLVSETAMTNACLMVGNYRE
jgi:hypothetical protein